MLHLFTAAPSETALSVIERQCREPAASVIVVLLHGGYVPALPAAVTVRRLAEEGREGDLTYSALLDLIFSADSAIAW
ncbi:MAG: hypothetical protein ACE5JN_07170 [Candidatus Methylomirabilia bacterium]